MRKPRRIRRFDEQPPGAPAGVQAAGQIHLCAPPGEHRPHGFHFLKTHGAHAGRREPPVDPARRCSSTGSSRTAFKKSSGHRGLGIEEEPVSRRTGAADRAAHVASERRGESGDRLVP